jgi:hypothetical protein
MESQNQQQELSEKARQNLQRNAELRNKDSKFFNPQPGEKSIWIFDAEKIQPVEKEFDGKSRDFNMSYKTPIIQSMKNTGL